MNQKDILLLLLQNGKMTFQQLINEFSNRGSENRKRCDELLKQLTKNQLILKTPNNDVKGQMKWYSLTEKGLKACSIYIGDDLKQNYKNMKALRFAQSDPDKLRAYLLSGTKTATQEAIVNCRSEKEFIDRINSFV
jgi:DNA-binding PadR family transcriptional regulator